MCGIAGFIDPELSQEKAALLIDSMCQIIRHRGPDDQGTWVGDGAALGMRRLSIIDVAGGHQPIFNEDQSILIVFNGEIYNYQELKQQLQERGHHFQTNSDTEAIIHAYEEYGDDCPIHLRGMFAFAIWDRKRQRLLAARDRFGKKPLHYYWNGERLIFGSEIKSLLEAGIPREVNYAALDEYLVYRYVPAPNTLFKNVMKLPAAHTLVYEEGKLHLQRYWDLPFTPTCYDDEATALERIRELIKDAVRVRLMSEVPLGAFLSGGIDSSVVVGFMSQMMSQPVKTFSIGFEEDDYSELPYARKVAEHFGTEHQEFFVKPDLISVLPQLVWDYDEPFGDSSMLPTYYVSKLAREYVTVVLTGDGGDEIFGGYKHYLRELEISRIPGIVRIQYLLIQSTRFRDRLTLHFEIDQTALDMRVPPLTLQPIIENAFVHGLEPSERPGQLLLSIQKAREYIVVSVQDNGVGISREQIYKLLHDEDEDVSPAHSTHTTGLGLAHVRDRLHHYYGDRCTLTIESEPGSGTTVRLLLPADGLFEAR